MGATQLCGKTKNGTQIWHITPDTKVIETLTQKIVGTLIYYARAVEPTMMSELGYIYENQANSNETTAQATKQLLDYCVTHPDATRRCNQNDMVIRVHSDGFYLS